MDDWSDELLAEHIRACEEGRHPSPSKQAKFRTELRKRVPKGCLMVYDDQRCNTNKLSVRKP